MYQLYYSPGACSLAVHALLNAVGVDFALQRVAIKEKENRTPEQSSVVAADQTGDRHTLKADAFIPGTMAVIYLLLLLYFKSIGGYKPLKIEEQ